MISCKIEVLLIAVDCCLPPLLPAAAAAAAVPVSVTRSFTTPPLPPPAVRLLFVSDQLPSRSGQWPQAPPPPKRVRRASSGGDDDGSDSKGSTTTMRPSRRVAQTSLLSMRIHLRRHKKVLFCTKYTHPTLICRGTDARTLRKYLLSIQG